MLTILEGERTDTHCEDYRLLECDIGQFSIDKIHLKIKFLPYRKHTEIPLQNSMSIDAAYTVITVLVD
jgi:hypothetical protein